jgi:CHAT domain-containing protein
VQADGDLDWAIELCRDGLRRLRHRSYQERHFGYIVLVDLLVARWATDRPQGQRALAEATDLCRSLTRRRATRAQALGRLPVLLRMGGADRSEIARTYRAAFDEHSRMADDAAVEIAAEWSAWAIEDATADEVAEAHWRWLRAVAADVRRRTMRAHKEQRMSRVQGLAAETGTWLLRAGRARDAAVALEVGRAVLLTERMHRDRDGIEQRLAGAGHAELSVRWRTAQEQIARTDRDGFAARRAETATMLVGGRRFAQRFASADHRALTEHERLLREISRLPGFEDVDVEPDYEDLAAAAGEGPVVYLVAAERGGHALIVTADAYEPVVVALPELCEADVVAHVQRLVRCRRSHELSDELAVQAPWLWSVLMEPIVTRLAAQSLVTLIPLGPLSMLTLHIAGMTPGRDGIWRDRTDSIVFRYAPNARVLRRAQDHARALDGGEGLRVLTVNVPAAPGESSLHATVTESAGVAARFGPERCERPSPPNRASVLSALDRCAIWHFACHGVHDPMDPLESRLALSDGPLTLRAIFARPAGRRRLAVLSACRSAMPDESLLDEVVGFPSALLQAGVAGVVSSQVNVGDRAAMLLVLRFFDEVADGTSPPRALARAQAWLSSATNGEIHHSLPDALPFPAGLTEAELEYWEGRRQFSEPHCWAPFSYCGA